jgi:hypothetical protein
MAISYYLWILILINLDNITKLTCLKEGQFSIESLPSLDTAKAFNPQTTNRTKPKFFTKLKLTYISVITTLLVSNVKGKMYIYTV